MSSVRLTAAAAELSLALSCAPGSALLSASSKKARRNGDWPAQRAAEKKPLS